MREKETSSERASAFASIVFPTPGKSSRIRWPSATRQRTQSRSVSSGACKTRARLATIAPIIRAAAAVSTPWLLPGSASLTQQLLRPLYDRRGNSVFRGFLERTLAFRVDENDFVVRRVEAHIRPGDIVVDNEIDALADELLAGARKALLALIGCEGNEHLAVSAALRQLTEDVRGRLELDRPMLGVLETL